MNEYEWRQAFRPHSPEERAVLKNWVSGSQI
jgi:hypothetical protein